MVMHRMKPQRMNDGYFEKHQTHPYQGSKYSSKRDYERDSNSGRSSSNYGRNNDRTDNSPSSGGGATLNNGNNSYRSNSPDLDSPPRHDIRDSRDRGGGGGGGDRDRFSYLQKMKERERDVYKKDKYSSDKRERRNDRDSEHKTNHDRIERRTSKLSTSTSGGDKHSGPDDRDRDRDRDRDIRDSSKRDRNDRDRDRERERDRDRDRDNRNDRDRNERDRGGDRGTDRNERNERVTRIGDWSEHVSSSGKMYYYNCKTEVSQWEKPKEWIEKERTLLKDQHREFRDKDRERERDERFPPRSAAATYNKHSSSRSNSRLRWPYEADGAPPTHRRRQEDNPDMDISPGDSTPTSETNYSVSSTPTAQLNDSSSLQQISAAVGTSSICASSSTPTATPQPILLANALPRLASHPPTSTNSQLHFSSSSSSLSNVNVVSGVISSTMVASSSSCLPSVVQGTSGNCHRKLDGVLQTSLPAASPTQSIPINAAALSLMHHQQQQSLSQSQSSSVLTSAGISCPTDLHINSNAPGPPPIVSVSNYQKVLSQAAVGSKSTDQQILDNNTQKTIQTINTTLMRQQSQPQTHYIGGSLATMSGLTNDTTSNANQSLENSLNSSLYNLTHMHNMSPLNHNKNPSGIITTLSGYTCNTSFGLMKTVESMGGGNTSGGGGLMSNLGSSSSVSGGEGPPTPTQELDSNGSNIEQQRKLEGTSASLSSLQSCVTSVQSGRSQGPDLSPKLAKYFRADLITHVTNWPADILEKQAQKCSEDTHIYGDLQCTKVSADLKCARSLVRITEITATLQEQKIMYLRQQIRRLEELKSQNSFMSDDL